MVFYVVGSDGYAMLSLCNALQSYPIPILQLHKSLLRSKPMTVIPQHRSQPLGYFCAPIGFDAPPRFFVADALTAFRFAVVNGVAFFTTFSP